MTWHTGRLIDHVHLRARNFVATRHFYTAVLGVLGLRIDQSGEGWFQVDELFVDAADARTIPTHIHLAFQARDRAMVDAFYKTALAAGGRDNGAPGERHYHPGYYAAFVLDPDGNNIEAVFHGPVQRSAASVELNPA
ncbi:MAG: VOC family protein [Alphaproteobacteria bacterium]|jgi:catechol 2,3-dioxygenase-like lactoylglutathione lyase family enzyme|nr:VOC family protein [Alphaproteobacteria bacterium]MBU1560174.1 VOC family protein [Alphaproteobacteria bacterium]MBU2303272.1 VOC family protein [Alphaproteobacteria bacterium]MBU2370302.1 VOC family protein [Alphaproteobacteria bacterium]